MFDNYNPQQYDPNKGFEVPPPGKHRVRVEEAEVTESKSSGKTMIKLSLAVSGHSGRVFHYFVDNEYIQQNMDKFFDSFGIKPGDFNVLNWRGKVGAAVLRNEEYKGEPQAKVSYFILKSKQGDLPAWAEKGKEQKTEYPSSLREEPDFGTVLPNGNVHLPY